MDWFSAHLGVLDNYKWVSLIFSRREWGLLFIEKLLRSPSDISYLNIFKMGPRNVRKYN